MAGEWLVVCIAGVTCGGKTKLVESINSTIKGCVLVSQADYVLPKSSETHIYNTNQQSDNYETMESFDMEKMRAQVQKVLGRKTGSEGKTYGRYHRILLLDGSQVLSDPELSSICYVKIFIQLSKEECWARRELGSYSHNSSSYFENYVWPEQKKNQMIAKQLNSYIIIFNGSKPFEENLQRSLFFLNQLYNSTDLAGI